MKILIDNGHGVNTSGKQSPDGRLREYAYAREIAKRVENCLKCRGYDAERIVTEEEDISLSTRCKRVNDVCRKLGSKNVMVVSIHNNAAGGDGKWHDARGFSAHVPACKYIAQNLAICRDTMCAAVLTENLFQDNKDDVDFLLSEEGKQKITELHVNAIITYIKSL